VERRTALAFRQALLGRSAAANLRALLPQRGIGEGLEGLVQVDELVRDPREPLLVVEPPVQRVDLVAEPVEPLENGVELPVVEMLAVGRHTPILAV